MRIHIKILFVIVLLGGASCGKEFLEKTPFNAYSTENFFENEAQITQAVNALYPAMRGFQTSELWKLGEFRTDNTTFIFNPSDRGAVAFESLDYFLAESNNGEFGKLWNGCYTFISRCHFVLENIDEATFDDEDLREERRAETRFARAYYYMLLTRYFGKVPLIDRVILTEEESADIPRSPVADIYSQLIVPDLEFAIANLPDERKLAESGRASADAARMVLADAYFTQGDYAAALPLLRNIYESGRYALLADYRSIMDPTDPYNEEIIFGVQHNADLGQGAGFYINWLAPNSGED
ncbi:MAG: RagB/SusD family nutrient uptake outer membrane protein, partial [Bacteroidota bacterium]